jgi:hypothetical protein
MDLLLSTSKKDRNDHGCQPLLEAMNITPAPTKITPKSTTAPTPSSSSTRLNIPTSSSASSKRKLKAFDVPTGSTTARKKKKKMQDEKIDGMLTKLTDKIDHIDHYFPPTQSTSATAPAPAPAPIPGASSELSHVKAIDILVKDIKETKQDGEPWLSQVDLMNVAKVFRDDPKSAEIYITFANSSGSTSHSRQWIRQLL